MPRSRLSRNESCAPCALAPSGSNAYPQRAGHISPADRPYARATRCTLAGPHSIGVGINGESGLLAASDSDPRRGERNPSAGLEKKLGSRRPWPRRQTAPALLSHAATERGHKTDTSETTRATSRDASAPPATARFAGESASRVIDGKEGVDGSSPQRASGFFLLSWSFRCRSGRRLTPPTSTQRPRRGRRPRRAR